MKLYPNVLIVAGSGRNVGKTTLASQLIEKFKHEKVTAIKVSSHIHQATPEGIPYFIEEETQINKPKDSSRFLKAGAAKVYYIQVHDDYLKEAFEEAYAGVGKHDPVIVEAGGLANYVIPGLLLFVSGDDSGLKNVSLRLRADKVLTMHQQKFDIFNISFVEGKWKLK